MEQAAVERLRVLSKQLHSGEFSFAGGDTQNDKKRNKTRENSLTIIDNRTGDQVDVEISQGSTVRASDFKKVGKGDLRLYDPGYTNTAACISRISYIDGARGILRYRGYPIEILAQNSNFTEVSFLLIYGSLPNTQQFQTWQTALQQSMDIPTEVQNAVYALPRDSHPMAIMITAIMALSTLFPHQNPAIAGSSVYNSKTIQDKQIMNLIGKAPGLAALVYHRCRGTVPHPGNEQLNYADNFLYMLDSKGGTSYVPNPRLARAMDIMFLLHAEHEMNCSTAACRHLASSGVDVYAAVAGAVAALYGPLHGGANEAVLKMLERIGTIQNIPSFLQKVKNRQEKLFGFGHRVYKNFDPRGTIIKQVAEEVFLIAGKDPLIDLAVELQNCALQDEYFVSRKLYPNVDFYSGLVYRALGFPTQYFTVLFAVPRIVGYLAHWREQLSDTDVKIARPQQDYRGEWLKQYVPIVERVALEEEMSNFRVSNEIKRKNSGQNWS
eukprot:TRINITY_DN2532_c1_g1_i2.p1 TRINITY_DN2532_c1_g1~~TRINITY_DN2532_c1_g1_i2.p1  ORF type:complete len:495 (-),score=75.93 TRINITY_DN2532_c1_g1_i2:249-1733(-)